MYKDLVEAEQLGVCNPLEKILQDVYSESSPYHWSVDGTPESLLAVTAQDVRDYHRLYYR